jgi:hypothetical protein
VLVYCNHNQHYFISNCSNIAGGDPTQHDQLKQLEPIEMYDEPQHEFAKLSAGTTTILLGEQENQPTQLVAKQLGNREEDKSEVLGQTGEYFDVFHDCGGFLPAP